VDLKKNQIRTEAFYHFQTLSAVRCLLDVNERKPVKQNFFQRSAEGIVWIDNQYFKHLGVPRDLVAGMYRRKMVREIVVDLGLMKMFILNSKFDNVVY